MVEQTKSKVRGEPNTIVDHFDCLRSDVKRTVEAVEGQWPIKLMK